MPRYFSIGAFARIAGVTQIQLVNWNRMGILRPHSVGPNGTWRYSPEQLDNLPSRQFSTAEVAEIFGVSVSTICYWDKIGKLKPCYRTSQNHRIYTQAKIERML